MPRKAAPSPSVPDDDGLIVEYVSIADLRPHPRNYQGALPHVEPLGDETGHTGWQVAYLCLADHEHRWLVTALVCALAHVVGRLLAGMWREGCRFMR